ncbi:MAG TPA: hypothetical protein VHN80_06915 [Kineosporiaceae bacterium]|nr:hypothetical protein [Kineosporiaceae bacterium]
MSLLLVPVLLVMGLAALGPLLAGIFLATRPPQREEPHGPTPGA